MGTLPWSAFINLSDLTSLETIDSEWSVPNKNIEKAAIEFLKNILSNKTIPNYPGVGTGIKLFEKNQKNIFLKEFESLVQGLIINRNN